MSGSNPFRRRERESGVSPPHPKSGAITHTTTIAPVARAEDFTDHTAPRSKIVRIASPPVPASTTSPANAPFPDHSGLHHRSYTRQYDDSTSDSQEDRASTDPFEADQLTTDDDDPEQQSRHNAKWDPTMTDSSDDDYGGSARSSHHETLQPLGGQRLVSESPVIPRETTPGPGSNGSKRATMDVDAFTRLLLTGDAGTERTSSMKDSPNASNRPRTAPDISNESRSSADAVSISRQSASEYCPSVGADTPRTSHEMSSAEAEAGYKVQINRQGSERKQKPPPPKARHGKLIKSDGNQQPTPQPTTSHFQPNTPGSYISQPQSINTSSPGTSKTVTSPSATDYFTTTFGDQTSRPGDSPDRKPSQSKRPPTPPLARRRSQMKHVKSSASVSKPSQIIIAEASVESKYPTTPSPGIKNPPPPPSRRHGRAISAQLSDGSSPPAFPFPQRTSSTSSGPPGGEESERGASPASSRTPSIRSARRVSQPLGSSPSNMPPPPPPPRRTRSPSRGSTDSSRPRSFHLEKENEPTVPVAEPSNADSILADLTRLQQEVDALRGQYESRKPSH
ncbi:hypothetical protein DTO045G8_3470 [Paecilomyces variotii]|nr:hypothetical protein DTO045G8_3470 [Paecilomyces variotii]